MGIKNDTEKTCVLCPVLQWQTLPNVALPFEASFYRVTYRSQQEKAQKLSAQVVVAQVALRVERDGEGDGEHVERARVQAVVPLHTGFHLDILAVHMPDDDAEPKRHPRGQVPQGIESISIRNMFVCALVHALQKVIILYPSISV